MRIIDYWSLLKCQAKQPTHNRRQCQRGDKELPDEGQHLTYYCVAQVELIFGLWYRVKHLFLEAAFGYFSYVRTPSSFITSLVREILLPCLFGMSQMLKWKMASISYRDVSYQRAIQCSVLKKVISFLQLAWFPPTAALITNKTRLLWRARCCSRWNKHIVRLPSPLETAVNIQHSSKCVRWWGGSNSNAACQSSTGKTADKTWSTIVCVSGHFFPLPTTIATIRGISNISTRRTH